MATRITFGAALSGEGHRRLRRRLRSLAAERPGSSPLHADGVLSLFVRFEEGLEEGSAEAPPAASFLLFDLHRLLLFEAGGAPEGSPGLEPVVRAVVEGYPLQPVTPLLGAIRDGVLEGARQEPQPFLYPLETLDVLPVLWARSEPGRVTVCDLRTGEIEVVDARAHPVGAPPPSPARGPVRLEERRSDRSFRPAGEADLAGLVSRTLGPVRERWSESGFSSLPYAAAVVARRRGARRDLCFGKGFRSDAASAVATFEALERFQVAHRRPGEEPVRGTYAELRERAVDPRRLFFGRAQGCPEDVLPPYAVDLPLHWTRASPVDGGEDVLVPAQEVWFDAARLPGETRLVKATTNGCAVGRSLEDAALFALLEAVERDAFLVAWYLRRGCPKIDPDSVEHLPFQLLRRRFGLVFGGYDLHLFDLTLDTRVPAVLCAAVRREGEGPRVFVAAAAHLSVAEACFGALKDVTGFTPPRFTPERREEHRRILEAPAGVPDRVLDRVPDWVKGPADHFGLWGLDETFPCLGFLDLAGPSRTTAAEVQARGLVPPAERHDLRSVLGALAGHLRGLGVPLLLKDLTHPWVAERGLRCVRAIAPGLYPIWYGGRTRRFAVTGRLRRLALELTGRPLEGPEDCNLFPHPFT